MAITPLKMAPSISEPVMPKDRSMDISNEKRNLVFQTSVVKVSSRGSNPMNIKPCVVQKKRPVFATHFDDEEESSQEPVNCIEDSPQNDKPVPCQEDAFMNSQQCDDSELVSPENQNDDCLADSDENLTNSESFSQHSKRDTNTVENREAETPQLSLKRSFYGSSSEKDKSQRHGPRPKRSLPPRKSSDSDSEKSQDSEPSHSDSQIKGQVLEKLISDPSPKRNASKDEVNDTPISLHSSDSQEDQFESPTIPRSGQSHDRKTQRSSEQRKRSLDRPPSVEHESSFTARKRLSAEWNNAQGSNQQRKRSLDRTPSIESDPSFTARKRLSVETPINSLPSYQPIKSQLIRRQLNDMRERTREDEDVLQDGDDDVLPLSSGTSSAANITGGGSGSSSGGSKSMTKTQLDVLAKIEVNAMKVLK